MTVTIKRSSNDLKSFNSNKKMKTEDGGGDKTFNRDKTFKPKFDKNKKFSNTGKFNKFSKGNNFKSNNKPYNSNKDGKPNWKSNNFSNNRSAEENNGQNGEMKLEKPDWKQLKQSKKELKLKRKITTKSKDLYELTQQAKQIYEKLKCRTTPNREELARELHKLLKGGDHYTKLVLAHDTARVVQCMLKQAPAEIKNEITQELIPNIVQMATSKYSRFCVQRMLKYGSNGIRERIINQMIGNVVKLTTHNMSSNLTDQAFITWGTTKQRFLMKQEFYGDLYKSLKDENIKYISDTWKTSGNLKSSILNSVKKHLEHAINKNLVDNSIIHTLLMEYIQECSEEERNEMVQIFSPLIASLCSTKDGTRASCMIFWYSGNKERRTIMKTIKEHIIKLCVHEQGYAFILTVITTLDDTVNLKKIVLDTILKEIEAVVSNKWGRKIIEWIVSPGDKTYFHPFVISAIEEGLKHCKKDVDVKRKEILESIEKPICSSIANNGKLWLQGGHTALATVAILKTSKSENYREALDSISQVICDPEWMVQPTEESEIVEHSDEHPDSASAIVSTNESVSKPKKRIIKNPLEDDKVKKIKADPILGIEHAGLHIALKKLAKYDSEKIKTNEQATFGQSIVDHLTDETLEKWITLNRACFLLITIFENNNDDVKNNLKGKLKKFKKLLKEQTHSGSKVLIKKL